jgi:hypothetical protein
MHRRLCFLLFVFLWTTAALAQFSSASQPGVKLQGRSIDGLNAAQRVLVSSYCRLDFAGARLQPAGWNRFEPFTLLRANPEFTRVTIVTRFDVESQVLPSDQLTVRYQRMGYYQQGAGYTRDSGADRVEFQVKEHNGALLVTGISPEAPHVSARAAIAWMNLLLDDPKTTELERAHLKDAVMQLNRSLPKPGVAAGED